MSMKKCALIGFDEATYYIWESARVSSPIDCANVDLSVCLSQGDNESFGKKEEEEKKKNEKKSEA
jgi:hypothetical protein